ncbi:hypothetical protein O1611_g2946 [Lasiodiplodia mahajangana]|uniref:Uncharacterized protein n=1 Tax=Lasiodiplodia mahajangana TaxID=1108764 RepID=A0ACC2JT50_9PEZI|nr:hypothetical protein O1611_g2946 [Lasiodiplodia mahajangana]
MSSSSLATYNQVNQEITFGNEHQAFWWNALARSLATLLATSDYSNEAQLYYLRWFHRWLLRSLGPKPVNGKPHYGSSFTYDGSPLEYSVNWKEKKADQTIRFTTEPCSPEAGTAADPLNDKMARTILSEMAKEVPGIDLARFDLFLSETRVPDESIDEMLSKLPPGYPRARVLIAFDLERGTVVAKAYFNPGLKAFLEGRPTKDVVFDAVRKCKGPAGSYDASIEAVNAYMESFDPREAPQVTLLSNDCVADSATSRVKVYFMAPVQTLAQAKDAFHLGGRLSGPTIEGSLTAIERFWCHLFNLSSSDPDLHQKQVLPARSTCIFVFEMRPLKEGQTDLNMEVKMHMPASWLGDTDTKISEVMSSWFRKHEHPNLATRYGPDLAATFPKHNLSTSAGLTHTWVSLTWTEKTGLYMTMYYTPKVPEFYFLPEN